MTITDSARRLALVAVVAMLAALFPLSGALAQDPPVDPPVDEPPAEGDRIAIDLDGQTAVEYAIRWSQVHYDSDALAGEDAPTNALLGRDDVFADSLSSGVLQGAATLNAPLLLTPSDSLSADTLAELDRLGVENVTVLGLEVAISEDVVEELEEEGYTVDRQGGQTRIETAIDIAEDVDSDTAILARAFGTDEETQAFADSLAAGGWAAEAGYPVLLTESHVLTGNTADHLEAAGYTEVIIVGGEAAVSADVEAQVGEIADTVTRVGGGTRFETAIAIAEARGYASPDDSDGTILVDGQVGTAWADGFPAAHLAGTGAPIVLSNSADTELPAPTREWLEGAEAPDDFTPENLTNVVLICGSTVPDGDEASAPNQCGEAADILGATVIDFVPPGEVGVTVSGTVARGEDVTITIAGAQVGDEIIVSGCGIEETTVTVTEDDIDEDGNVVLTFPIPASQAEGDCDITVSVNGEEFVTTVTVTEPPGNVTVTTRPELVRAELGATTTTTNQTPTNPAGTLITYVFDEPVASAAFGNFLAYASNNTQYVGDALVGFTPGDSTVTVRFTDAALQTAAGANALTLATVNVNAVTASDGQNNPEGDAPIGTGQTTTVTAGTTDAPDLQTVGNFRTSANATQTAVDFTFDENAWNTGAGQFALVFVDQTGANEEIFCTPPAPGDTTGSGGTVAGGNGTMTITVICENENTAGATSTTTLNPANFARGYVTDGTVSDAAAGGNTNPLHAAVIAGASTEPDLLSAEFQPAAATGTDRVIYVFDQAVATATNAALFNVYLGDDTEVSGNTIVQVSSNRVAVDFNDNQLSTAVGASVDQDAVNTGNSEPDEVAVQNTTATQVTRGETAGPQLTAVTLSQGVDATGASTGFQAVFAYDEDVDVLTIGDHKLYLADGTRAALIATTCTVGTTEDTDNLVTCQFAGSTSETIGTAVLGAVDDGAVDEQGAGGLTNPEGSVPTTGGTGTPA